MIGLLDLGISLLEAFLGKIKSQVPLQVTQAVQAAIDAVAAHHADLVTKAALDANRG